MEAPQNIALAEEKTLSLLLEKSANLNTMEAYLQDGIESLIQNVPYLNLLPKGGILLTEKHAEKDKLHLVAKFQLSPEIHSLCEYVDFGYCLCGRAAESKEIQYASCIDHRHDISFDGIQPHGHYNIPILSNDEVLGVIVLYLPDGHKKSTREINFLQRVSGVFSLGISLRNNINELESTKIHAENLTVIAENSKKMMTQFLVKVSQKLRNPVHGVIGLAEVLQDTELDNDQQELVSTILENGSIFQRLISEFEDFAEIASDSIKAKEYAFSLNDVFNSITYYFDSITTDKNLILNISPSNHLPDVLYGSPKLIGRVLNILLHNAVKFSKVGGVIKVSAKEESKKAKGNCIVFSVEDTGVGINDAIIKELNSLLKNHQNPSALISGIGLYLCRELLSLVDGSIWVESRLNQGSKFSFTLPLKTES